MEKKKIKEHIQQDIVQQLAENMVERVKSILNREDGRSVEEKMKEVGTYLNGQIQLHKEKETDTAAGERIIEKFWNDSIQVQKGQIRLRKVCKDDKYKFFELQSENSIIPDMFHDKLFKEDVWKEHISCPTLACTILHNDEYVGYCAIKDVTRTEWEISIETLKYWHGKGIGYEAIKTFLTMVKERLQVDTFRVRIEADNYASQRLFEKLGAVPNGLSEFLLHNPEEMIKCEERLLHLIDERMIEVANKFQVEPRKLLTHVLEYKLKWEW